MPESGRAEEVIRDLERMNPYFYEGLYGNFLTAFMDSDKSRWSSDLSKYLSQTNGELGDIGSEIGQILWEKFEERISC